MKRSVMEERGVDAENTCRVKVGTAGEHLQHLLKIGHSKDSTVIKNFAKQHGVKLFGKENFDEEMFQ